MVASGWERGRLEDSIVWDVHVHRAGFKVDNWQGPTLRHRQLHSELWGSLKGGEFGRKWMLVYLWLSPFTVHLKLSQYCQSAIPRYKIKKFKEQNKIFRLETRVIWKHDITKRWAGKKGPLSSEGVGPQACRQDAGWTRDRALGLEPRSASATSKGSSGSFAPAAVARHLALLVFYLQR